ncbi:CrcB family protein [Nocardioides sp. AE5]|uniref:FluC/FEX family fluoride channel n=1 Tax=Nocardioides sp. AE5 TaxID=2962573 RepID=UPI0028819B77|nr:CrcB family protein [Nocardioides sp. AE5]MDT0200313.1 CrcB family protein [Nocardioides sp. AE5]
MPSPRSGTVLGAVALGGALGALARHGAATLWPTGGGDFPWTTTLVNVIGCALTGIVLVLVLERAPERPAHPLAKPFLATGFLGGFTTFSAYAVEVERLFSGGHAASAVAYLVLTPVLALLAVWTAATAVRRARRPRAVPHAGGGPR